MATPTPPTPPLTLVTNRSYGHWECFTCVSEFVNNPSTPEAEERPWETPTGELVCSDCIKSLFEQALKFDIDFPARWGSITLNIDDFAVLWPDRHFPTIYKAKAAYLHLQLFSALQNPESWTPEGLVHGRDIQPCPKCKTPWGLRDGCNHIICKSCGANYCFICGEEARGNSAHWVDGSGCPRYNHPEDADAMYDDVEDQADWGAEMAFEVWLWNLTMQNGGPMLQAMMQRMLGLPIQALGPDGPLDETERRFLLSRMLEYRPQHGVSEEVWDEVAEAHRHEAEAFMGIVGEHGNFDEGPITRGVLASPIGGVFNLSSETSRRHAYEWAQQRYNAWTPATADSSLNYAIFDIGPGTPVDSEEASEVLEILSRSGEDQSGGTMEFIVIENPRSQFMLVQITGVNDNPAHRGNPLSYWRLEFIRPRNARERAHREQQREDDWARLEAEAGFLTAELERREALHLERAIREDIRDNHQPNANNTAAPQQPQPRRLVDFDHLDRLDQLNQLDRQHVERAMREDIRDNRQPNANNNIAAPHQPQPRRLVDIDHLDRLDRLDGIGRPVGTALERQREADRQQETERLERRAREMFLQQETDRLDRRAREMFRQRREAAEADQAEDETFADRDSMRAQRDGRPSVSPRPRRRQPFAEQSLEPWAPTPEDNHLPNAGSDFWDEF